jgi:hypothetical protein
MPQQQDMKRVITGFIITCFFISVLFPAAGADVVQSLHHENNLAGKATPGNATDFTIQKISGHLKAGSITGMVSIGPLCPVEPCSVTDTARAAALERRKIVIKPLYSMKSPSTIPIGPDGSFRAILPPGTYLLDLLRTGIDRSPDLPKKIVVKPGKSIFVNISVDTGIR